MSLLHPTSDAIKKILILKNNTAEDIANNIINNDEFLCIASYLTKEIEERNKNILTSTMLSYKIKLNSILFDTMELINQNGEIIRKINNSEKTIDKSLMFIKNIINNVCNCLNKHDIEKHVALIITKLLLD